MAFRTDYGHGCSKAGKNAKPVIRHLHVHTYILLDGKLVYYSSCEFALEDFDPLEVLRT